ncbi:nuclear transport factor 2 family protein [Roseibacterium beibuensis]|uniref:nuclear transport factor 2 family protein n=1 Tax=[Roseibacterium] beibuensis TaxID=1193142 RepID=UPI00217EE7FF|nr:nuclear transport factor 2 family protein [Roseibacterium beibuensis]MCS6625296.1 nuclear transport factor 2 family protein [Roseibacterium beibuensis]
MLELVAALALTAAPPPPTPEEDAAAVIDALHAAASSADGAAYFDLFTPDARFIGTDATERWTLAEFRAYAEPYFARGQGWTYTPVERSVTLAPIQCLCIAWFDEVLENDSYGVTRGSGVLRKTRSGWKIEQYVLSFAVPNDRAQAVAETIAAE